METDIRIGKRRITPLFDLAAWEAIEEEHGSIDALLAKLDSKDIAERRKATLDMATILCNNAIEAEREAGKADAPAITRREMARATPPKRVPDVRYACISAINKGMRSDYDPADEEPVDVVLEENAKKNKPGE